MDPEILERASQDISYDSASKEALARRIGQIVVDALWQWEHENDGFPERTNLDRALNGRDMAALALTGSSYMAYEDYEYGLVDALTNLMHFARRYRMDFDQWLECARDHHAVEREHLWDEVPK